MPRLSVYMIRAALLHLGIGFTFGALLLLNKGVPFEGSIWRLLPAHIELVMFGWTMQLAMGVAFWILPRFSTAPRYGRERLGWLSFLLINSGVILAAVSQWAGLVHIIILARMLTLTAVVCFAAMIWPRVKPFADSIKELVR
jgi:cbb3-type cytochrome oxidase subunit 1